MLVGPPNGVARDRPPDDDSPPAETKVSTAVATPNNDNHGIARLGRPAGAGTKFAYLSDSYAKTKHTTAGYCAYRLLAFASGSWRQEQADADTGGH